MKMRLPAILKRLASTRPSLQGNKLAKQKQILDLHAPRLLMDQSQPKFVTEGDMQPADVLLCAKGTDVVSKIISEASAGDYVHAAIYVGNGQVIEAVRKGVVKIKLTDVIARYTYIAVTRCPGTKPNGRPDFSRKVVEFCEDLVTSGAKYNIKGAIKSPKRELIKLQELEVKYIYYPPQGQNKRADGYYCSQLVVDAFTYGGYIPESQNDSASSTPSSLAEHCLVELVGYMGDRSRADYIRKKDYWLTGTSL
ncbi:hypothetical protein ACVTMO_02460 [Pseudomonas segetis]